MRTLLAVLMFLPCAPSWAQDRDDDPARNLYETALTARRAGKVDEAIDLYGKILAMEPPKKATGLGFWGTRGRAQWELALCYAAKKDFAGAAEAFRISREEIPRPAFCGNCRDQFQCEALHNEGACLERVGKFDEAVRRYFLAEGRPGFELPTTSLRLANLYETAGQLNDLLSILDRRTEAFERRQLESLSEFLRRNPGPIQLGDPCRQARGFLNLKLFEREGRWDALVARIPRSDVGFFPEGNERALEADEAAKAIARHPDQAVPRLAKKLGTQKTIEALWTCYALGLCGTPEAVALIRNRASIETHVISCESLVYTLSIAGENGNAAMKALEATAKGNLKLFLKERREQRPVPRSDWPLELLEFPAIPAGVKLPKEVPLPPRY